MTEIYIHIDARMAVWQAPASERAVARMLSDATDPETQAWRCTHLKMLPHIEHGGFVVKKVVGTRPVRVAKDAQLSTIHVCPTHVELDIDVSRTYIGQKVCSVLQGFAPSLVVDIGFLVEGGTDGSGAAVSGSFHGCFQIV